MEVSKWRLRLLRPYFRRTAKRFVANGYPAITWRDIERYFVKFAWKRMIPDKYQQQKQAILGLEVNDYFDFERLEATVFNVSPLDKMDIDNLL